MLPRTEKAGLEVTPWTCIQPGHRLYCLVFRCFIHSPEENTEIVFRSCENHILPSLFQLFILSMSRDSSVCIVMGYGLDGRSFNSRQGQNFSLLHSKHTGSRACPASYSVYYEIIPRGSSGRGVKLPTHFHLVSRSGMLLIYIHSPLPLHGMVLNC
jgi:hypothetical protein